MSGKRIPKGLLPILVIVVGVLGTVAMLKLKPEPPRRPAVNVVPLVSVEPISGRTPVITVRGYGEVNARRKVNLVARVSGQVAFKSPALAGGAYFEQGDTLLVIEQDDYRLARDMAAAGVATAEYNLARAEQEAEIARREWNGQNAAADNPTRARPNPLVLHGPQLKSAQAGLASARAVLGQAELNLGRCLVIAPFTGRVIAESVDAGQYLAPGAAIGSIYATDVMEVDMPVDDMDLALFDAPAPTEAAIGAAAEVLADFEGGSRRWRGRVLRTGSAVDRQSRMVNVVIGVDNRSRDAGTPPLLEGMFVEVRIAGRPVPGMVAIPREALHTDDTIWIVDDQGLLEIRPVSVFHKDREQVILSAGAAAGETLVLSQMDVVSDGMKVRTGREKAVAGANVSGTPTAQGGGDAK